MSAIHSIAAVAVAAAAAAVAVAFATAAAAAVAATVTVSAAVSAIHRLALWTASYSYDFPWQCFISSKTQWCCTSSYSYICTCPWPA